jgi:HEAT repeat protein
MKPLPATRRAAYLHDYLRETGAKTLDDLHELVESEAPAEKRATACLLLGHVGDRRSSVPVLVRAMNDPDIRGAAMNALESLGGAQARRRLVPLLKDPDPEIRWMSAVALRGADDDPSVIDGLVAALHDSNAMVRDNAAETLGILGSRRQRRRRAAALEAALADESPQVRYSAAFSLGMIGGASALPVLERLAKSDHASAFGETVADEAGRAVTSIRRRSRGRA